MVQRLARQRLVAFDRRRRCRRTGGLGRLRCRLSAKDALQGLIERFFHSDAVTEGDNYPFQFRQ